MIIWLDAHLPPSLAPWMMASFKDLEAVAVRELGLREANDAEIFDAARKGGAIVMTKDGDFSRLVERYGPPPQVIWIRCGNTSNSRMRDILASTLAEVLMLIRNGEQLVEITCE